MQVLNRRVLVIEQPVSPAEQRALFFRIEVGCQRHCGDGRLDNRFVAQILFLVFGLQRLDIVLRLVFVEDVGVVEHICTAGSRRQCSAADHDAGRADQAARQLLKARHQPGFRTPPPQKVRQRGPDHSDRNPVEPDGPARPAIEIVVVEVGKDRIGRTAAVEIQRVVETQIAQHHGPDEVDHHDPPADIFVGAQCLDEHRQDRQHHHVDRARHDIPAQIFADFEIGVTAQQLDNYGGNAGDDQRREQHEGDADGLGDHV